MTGMEIVGELLRANAAVTAMVSAEWIKGGALPDNAPLPSLLVRTVSLTDDQPLRRGPMVRSTARIAVTVRARDYREQRAVIKAVRTVCNGFTGDLAGAERIAILTSGLGPDLNGPNGSFEQTQDFRVTFDAPV